MAGSTLRQVIRTAGWVCLVLSCLPYFSVTALSTMEERTTTQVTLGLPSSPWFTFERMHVIARPEPGAVRETFSTSWRIEIVSWSTGLLILGITALLLASWLRRRDRGGPPALPDSHPHDKPLQ